MNTPKEQTAMMLYIDGINNDLRVLRGIDYPSQFVQHKISILTELRQKAISLLPTERKNIEDAYQTAQIEMVKIVSDSLGVALPKTSDELNKILNGEDNEDSSDYFTNKYNV